MQTFSTGAGSWNHRIYSQKRRLETDEDWMPMNLQVGRQNFTSAAAAHADVFESDGRPLFDGAVGVRVLLDATRDGAQHFLDEAARLIHHIVAAGDFVKFLTYIVIEAHELDDHAVAVDTAQRSDHFDDGRTAFQSGGHLRQLLGGGHLHGHSVQFHQRHQLGVFALVLLGPPGFEALFLLPPSLLLGQRFEAFAPATSAASSAAAAASARFVSRLSEWEPERVSNEHSRISPFRNDLLPRPTGPTPSTALKSSNLLHHSLSPPPSPSPSIRYSLYFTFISPISLLLFYVVSFLIHQVLKWRAMGLIFFFSNKKIPLLFWSALPRSIRSNACMWHESVSQSSINHFTSRFGGRGVSGGGGGGGGSVGTNYLVCVTSLVLSFSSSFPFFSFFFFSETLEAVNYHLHLVGVFGDHRRVSFLLSGHRSYRSHEFQFQPLVSL